MTESISNAWSTPLDTKSLLETPVPPNPTYKIIGIPDSAIQEESSEIVSNAEQSGQSAISSNNEFSSDKKIIVLDSGAIISCANLTGSLLNENVEFVTTASVIQEIKSSKARSILNSLPFPIKLKSVWTDSLKVVKEYAESTGDYSFLSDVDTEILALTYQLEKMVNGDKFLKKLPEKLFSGKMYFKAQLTPYPQKQSKKDYEASIKEDDFGDTSWGHFEDEEDNDDGWITKENIKEHNRSNFGKQEEWSIEKNVESFVDPEKHSKSENIEPVTHQRQSIFDENQSRIGCITTDFAMQNVLVHMGLNLISVDGYKILSLRRYVFRCSACFVIVPDTNRVFCPNCGNHSTLKRVECVIDENGHATFYYNPNYRFNLKGTRYQIPKPKGGKHIDPILREDQMISVRRGLKHKKIKGVSSSIFGEDLYSREYSSEGIFSFNKRKENHLELKDKLVLGKPKAPPRKFKKKSRN